MKVSPATLIIGAVAVALLAAVAWLTMMLLSFPPTQPGVTFEVIEVPGDAIASPIANLTENDLGAIPLAASNVIRRALDDGTASAVLTSDEYVQWDTSFDDICRRLGVEFPAHIRFRDRVFRISLSTI